jgi:hypothetical protein
MKDLKSSQMMWVKAILFLFIGAAAGALIIAEMPTLKVAVLLGLAVWGFCRAYYFAFYVIQHYVDPEFRFSGLWSFAGYCLEKKTRRPKG